MFEALDCWFDLLDPHHCLIQLGVKRFLQISFFIYPFLILFFPDVEAVLPNFGVAVKSCQNFVDLDAKKWDVVCSAFDQEWKIVDLVFRVAGKLLELVLYVVCALAKILEVDTDGLLELDQQF